MDKGCKRYVRALRRNLFELRYALSERNLINEVVAVAPETSWSFFSYAYVAMTNDMFSHAMKALDTHKDAVSFWFLYRCKKEEVDDCLNDIGLSFIELEKMTADLKYVRDKTHFHIDRNGVFDPRKVWEKAGITGDFFNKVIEGLWEILNRLHESEHGKRFDQPIYEADDVRKILNVVREGDIRI